MELINSIFQERINVIGNLHSRKTLTQRNMKKIFSLLMISALALFTIMVILPSCEGPQGPQGPAGTAGVDGTDGTDGVDANSFCIDCHSMEVKNTINAQFAASSHGPLNGSYARGASKTCAMCHAYQGYMETILTGRDTTAATIAIPMYFQCDMCHDFHGTLAEDEFPDYALRHNEPVSMIYNNHASTLDLAGSGNLCAYCHQPRPRTGFPLVPNGSELINVNSSHWGTHYGTASVLLGGQEGFEIAGSMPYENSGHTAIVGCSDCHMNKGGGVDVGGHTFKMVSDAGVQNLAACTSCHSGATSFDLGGIQTEIAALIHELDEICMEHKLTDDTGHAIPWNNAAGLGRMWTSNEAGVVYNLLLAHYEGSHGIHNYKYTKALLVNSIEEANKW